MKIVKKAIYLAVVSFCLNLTVNAQNITLNIRDITVKQAMNELKSKTGYSFVFSSEYVDTGKKVSVSVDNQPIDSAIKQILQGQGLAYEIKGRSIILRKDTSIPVIPSEKKTKKITGTVLDAKGEPVIGANVLVKGTTNGTITDIDGKFVIQDVPENARLQVSYIGFNTKEVSLANKTDVSIRLQEDTQALDEVVVVGYGIQKKVNLTGAVSAIKSEDIITVKNENVQNMLTGKVPGVRVVQKSGEPGSFNTSFDIRGLGNPLVVIDGVPRDNISRLDPNEIESFSVLKDASAAIYGVKAANGVVLITTKKGSEGKVSLDYSFNYGIQQPIGLPNPVNAIDQMTLYNEYTMTRFDNPYLEFGEEDFEPYKNGTKTSSDWQKAAIRNSAPISQHNMSISGSSSILSYFFNFGYLKQEGFWKSGDLNYDRYNVRANVDARITKRLKAELKTSAIMDTKNQPYGETWQVFKSLWRQSSTAPIYANNNPEYPGKAYDAAHTVVMTTSDLSGYSQYQNKWYQSSLSLVYDVPYITGLTAKAMYSYDYNTSSSKSYKKEYSLYTYDTQYDKYIPEIANSPSSVNRNFYEKSQTLMQLSLNYDRTFGKHHTSGLLLYEEGTQSGDNFFALRELSLPVDQLFAGNETNQRAGMSSSLNDLYDFATRALVGRFNYDYASKYLLEFSFRYDGSSKFKKEKRWVFFPAVSGGWRISEESFIKNNPSLSFVNNLKMRASWGKMGDDALYEFQYLQGYNYPEKGYIFSGELINGLGFRGVPNPNLTWFEGTTINLGLDVSLWDKKLGIEFDVFQRDLNGLFATRELSLPGTVGTALPQENLNSKRSQGYELMLSHYNHIGEFNYNVTAILSYTSTKWKHYEQAEPLSAWDNWKNNLNNRNENIWWGLEDDGVFTSYDEIYGATVDQGGGNIDFLPGDYKYQDWNGDGVIDSNDKHPIALKNLPMINFSTNIGASYKNIDFNMLLQGAANTYIEYQDQLKTPFPWGFGNILDIYLDRWHPEDPKADRRDPSTVWIVGERPAMNRPTGEGTAAIQNATYLRIKSVEVGYTIPKAWIRKLGVASARVYVNAYNLATLTKLKYLDPEHPGDENNNLGYLYPLNRSYNVGINVSF